MLISGRKIVIVALGLFAIFGLSQMILEQCADARAGGGQKPPTVQHAPIIADREP